jgi:hypothetical protein
VASAVPSLPYATNVPHPGLISTSPGPEVAGARIAVFFVIPYVCTNVVIEERGRQTQAHRRDLSFDDAHHLQVWGTGESWSISWAMAEPYF